MTSLNQPFTRLNMRRRYESWFLRMGLSDGSGAWWFRYLLTNPGRDGCQTVERAAPVQLWAVWFPRDGSPETFIQKFPLGVLDLGSRRGPFALKICPNCIQDNDCCGTIEVRGRRVSWDLRYRSEFRGTFSNKGWIGFSRTPHSDAVFSGEIHLDDRVFRGEPLGTGVQGHNCGFRHRHFWTWTHACFPQSDGSMSTFEALVYEMPLRLVFRKAVLWHQRRAHVFRKLSELRRDREDMHWTFTGKLPTATVELDIDGSGASLHRLSYAKTDCSGTFEVSNNSRASARLRLCGSGNTQDLSTQNNAVLEMSGDYPR